MTSRRFTVLYRLRGSRTLTTADATLVRSLNPFDLDLAREIPNYHGQTHIGGWYASSKLGDHVRFESGLERLRMQFLDFDPQVVAFAPQPFTLRWSEDKKTYSYTPDLLIIRAGQRRVVEDVKPTKFHGSPKLQRAFAAAKEALDPIGVDFNLWGAPESTLLRNVQYLAGYRRAPAGLNEHLASLLTALRDRPYTLMELARRVGHAPLVLPVIYHLIWHHRITVDLSQPLSGNAVLSHVRLPGEATS